MLSHRSGWCLGWLLLDERMDSTMLLVFLVAVGGAIIMLWDEAIGLPWPRDEPDWLAVSSLLLTEETVSPREWLGGGMIVAASYLAARLHAVEAVQA